MSKKGKAKATKQRFQIQLPIPLVNALDVVRTDMSRSELIEYFLIWYLETNLCKLLLTNSEQAHINKLIIEARGG